MPLVERQIGPYISQEIVEKVKKHAKYSEYERLILELSRQETREPEKSTLLSEIQQQIMNETACTAEQLLAILNNRYQS